MIPNSKSAATTSGLPTIEPKSSRQPHDGSELRQAAREARLDRSEGDVADRADFIERQLFEVVRRQNHAGQRRDLHQRALRIKTDRRIAKLDLKRFQFGIRGSADLKPALSPKRSLRLARRDAKGPGPKKRGLMQPLQPSPHPQENFLQDVVGCTRANDPCHMTTQLRFDNAQQLLKRSHVAGLGANDQYDVKVFGRCHRGASDPIDPYGTAFVRPRGETPRRLRQSTAAACGSRVTARA